MDKIEHIGIAVKNLEEAIPRWENLLGTSCYKREVVEGEQVETAFFRCGDSKIELIQSLTPAGVIARFIEKRGEGMHHIAYAVHSIVEQRSKLVAAGFTALAELPKTGADNKLVMFFKPSGINGVLTELCEEIRRQ